MITYINSKNATAYSNLFENAKAALKKAKPEADIQISTLEEYL